MAALKNNGSELARALRIQTDPTDPIDPDLTMTNRLTYSLRSNGAIMLKREHRFRDDPAELWRGGKWKRVSKLPARAWNKLANDDRRSWLCRKMDRLIELRFEIISEASADRLSWL